MENKGCVLITQIRMKPARITPCVMEVPSSPMFEVVIKADNYGVRHNYVIALRTIFTRVIRIKNLTKT